MCGLAGLWRVNCTAIEEMMRALCHRGPDDNGQYALEHTVLGHRRLAIVDCEGGHQPIINEDGSAATAVNGEIYNAADLRERLTGRHRFRSGSDSEVALHLYEDDGAGAVRSLDGMFALAIAKEDELFLARDPIGIKPLYVSIDRDSVAFASEIKALLSHAGSVCEFPPGTWFRTDVGFRQYFRLPEPTPTNLSCEDLEGRLCAALNDAVEKRMMSDVPLGTFLSGGLDSSVIAALVRERLSDLHTVSVGLSGSPDLEAARNVADHLGTIHHEYVFTAEEIIEALPTIIYHLESFDVDLVRSAVPCYFASRLAAEHMKVVLTGEGADELFAGYRYHQCLHGDALRDELARSVAALHNMNLQRVDRMTMAHSIEGRVPFLDLKVIELALRIPSDLKLRGAPPVEKWILRRTFEDKLPAEIIWRKKKQFDEGSGTAELLPQLAPEMAEWFGVSSNGVSTARELEQRVYRSLFCRYFPTALERLVARWRGGEAQDN
ncbi:MAG: asparagine synthase B [Gemmatimonadota bacterium]